MPRLGCTFRQVIEILERNGFLLLRHDGSSHRRYRGEVAGEVRFVDIAAHRLSDDVVRGTLKSIIRQSGLPERLFRR